MRPEQVVEIAYDGVQGSTRYPGGMALRFARVLRYRDDKSAAEADTVDTVREHYERNGVTGEFRQAAYPTVTRIDPWLTHHAHRSASRRLTATSPTSARTRICRRWRSSTGLPITTKHKIIFGVIAVLGAVAWAIIAFFRGETVNAVWFVIAAVCTYIIAFRFYARLIEMKIV